MNPDELTAEQAAAIQAVLREAPGDASLDSPRPSAAAVKAAGELGGDELGQRDLRRVARGLERAGLVAVRGRVA